MRIRGFTTMHYISRLLLIYLLTHSIVIPLVTAELNKGKNKKNLNLNIKNNHWYCSNVH